MRIIKATNYSDMSRKAANVISAQVILKSNCVLGLATGATVLGIYQQLIDWYEKGDIDFSSVHSVNLDEYVGLPAEHEQSYRYYMDHNFFHKINILSENTNLPNGLAENIDEECRRYDALIEKLGGIDLQLLGLGHNGHIGFNEPDQAFEKTTHCVTLKDSTIKANARFFEHEDQVPKKAVTMGIKSIMQAKRIVLCVSGITKAEILKKVLTGPVTPALPGSILQMHPNLTVVADAEALSLL
ncbi:glucosamine-6-phosphate deaminase [Sinanaerobacter chloroacetimidivorans]|uniref:Glucosamine-6-phosphate deaminase n=1 Tax=Sinanaerobacter chloroacetimidivorans TaxID=2818044 RepID=A0A8J7VZ06_9FIRM|nr:glucosamine-6-phosphate deaminase [Sinanaerobacter chloroacetimidivorans]MBR0597291.1 glucosamine-6-phosphate deaminase [Sinanaerobacter chloroacetimidivorans]